MVSSTSIRVRNTTNEETANNKSSFSKRRRPDSAYSSHQSIRDEEVSGEGILRSSRAASVAILPSALFVERFSLGASWASSFQQVLLPARSNSWAECRDEKGP